MPTIRNQVINAFVAKLGAKRALKFSTADRLPTRVVWDFSEEAEKLTYNKYRSTLQLQVESILDASGLDEGEVLDTALGALQTDALADDASFEDLIINIAFTGATYSYSEDGSSLVGLSAGFEITYQFLVNNPSLQEI